jgi:hypothetical protein
MAALGFTLANASAMAQVPDSSSSSTRVASIAQQFQSEERGWQQESMSSAARVAPMDRDAPARDSRASVEQMWRDKFLGHAMEAGAVYSAGINWPAFKSQPAADPITPVARMSNGEQVAYYQAIQKDAKP